MTEDKTKVKDLATELGVPTKNLLQALRELDIPLEDDGSLLIRREIRPHGRSSCKLNNIPATVSMLRAVGDEGTETSSTGTRVRSASCRRGKFAA